MNANKAILLSIMMFLQYFIRGAWEQSGPIATNKGLNYKTKKYAADCYAWLGIHRPVLC
jgi:hypothetical protein